MRKLTFTENVKLGFAYATQFPKIRKFPFLSPEEIKEYQFKKIQELVTLAYNETEFYKEKYTKAGLFPQDIKTWEDFFKLPTTSKTEIIEAGKRCIVKSKQSDQHLRISKSSGSSGKIINIYEDSEFWIMASLLALRMYYLEVDYKPFDKQVWIYTSQWPYQSVMGLYKVNFIYTLTPTSEIIAYLKSVKPKFISSYPSILLDILQTIDDDSLKEIRPITITTNSEYSSISQREYISKSFNCPVFDEYSSEEMWNIAYECKNHRYHAQEDTSYIEITDPNKDVHLLNGNIGEVTGTCLINKVMPFIRYRQGDLASMSNLSCSCGNNGRVMDNIQGRKNSYFTLKNGSYITSGRLLDWMYELILKYQLPIVQYQLTQKDLNTIILKVITKNKNIIERSESLINEGFRSHFSVDIRIKLQIVSLIEKTSAGKHIPIKSEINT